jgi:hypothetical protein
MQIIHRGLVAEAAVHHACKNLPGTPMVRPILERRLTYIPLSKSHQANKTILNKVHYE